MKSRASKIEGNAFENVVVKFAQFSGVKFIRIPDGCRRIPGPGGKPRLLPVKTPFDFVFGKSAIAVFADTKSISDKNFAFSQITVHQVDQLLDLEQAGFKAGYLVHFRRTGRIVFFTASKLKDLRTRESLSEDDGEDVGTIFDMRIDALMRCGTDKKGDA